MVNGVSGRIGTLAQLHVALEGKRDIDFAIILNLLLVEKIALETLLKQKIVLQSLVQVRQYLFPIIFRICILILILFSCS